MHDEVHAYYNYGHEQNAGHVGRLRCVAVFTDPHADEKCDDGREKSMHVELELPDSETEQA